MDRPSLNLIDEVITIVKRKKLMGKFGETLMRLRRKCGHFYPPTPFMNRARQTTF